MLKHIPKSDINLRPFKVYKTFTATEASVDLGYVVSVAEDSSDLGYTDAALLEKKALYHRIKTMYYNGDNALNPFVSYGTFKPRYNNKETAKQRSLKNRAIVLTIPQIKFGEGIKPNSVNLFNANLNETIYDDGYGNLSSNYNSYSFIKIDIDNSDFWFYDSNEIIIKTKIVYLDVENNELLVLSENNTFILLQIDIQNESISFLGTFTSIELNVSIIGNVIYSHGIIILTRNTDIGEVRENALNEYDLNYKSTTTIFENEYLLVVGEDEFNTSTNPTSYTELNVESGSVYLNNTTKYQINALNANLSGGDGGYVIYNDINGNEITLVIDANIIYNFDANNIVYDGLIGCILNQNQNVVNWRNSDKYQRTTLNNPYVSSYNGVSASGFDVYEYSSSIDSTGSYLAPYITTIGLYDENMDMVAVAKLATPVKSTPDLPVNFLVRFDT